MNFEILSKHFEKIGAHVSFEDKQTRKWYSLALRRYSLYSRRISGPPTLPEDIKINVRKIGSREVYIVDTFTNDSIDVKVIESRRDIRHLLLMVTDMSVIPKGNGKKPRISKFLCGHDERHWFVAAVPEDAFVKNVTEAINALKPAAAIQSQKKHKCKKKNRNKRKNKGYIRQGEWFFIPAPEIYPDKKTMIFRNEPLSRGGGSKPHIVQELFRHGGVTVYVHRKYASNGITEETYKKYLKEHPDYFKRKSEWRKMVRDAEAYCRGKVRHRDHKTVHLKGWHRVLMNTENKAWSKQRVVFLD